MLTIELFEELLPPGLLGALIITTSSLLIGFGIKFLFRTLLGNLLKRTKTKVDDEIVAALKNPVFGSVFILGLFLSFSFLEPQKQVLEIGRNAFATLGLLIWTKAGLKVLKVIFSGLSEKLRSNNKSTDAIPFLENTSKVVLIIIAALLALNLWGINITPLLASAGVVGIAVAFAAKDTISNLFGGISVFFDRPYKVGDYVIFANQYRGEVTEIGMRSTKIKTRDNVLLTIPNSVMVTDAVVNETGFDPKLRIRIPLSVSYNSNLAEVEKVLMQIAGNHSSVLSKPAPRVRYRSFGDSGIELELLGVIKTPPERGVTIHELIKDIHERFKKEGIEIPFPQRDVHILNNEN